MKSNKSGDINGQPLAQRLRVTIIQPPQPRRPFPPFGLIFQAVIMRLGVNSQTPYITLPSLSLANKVYPVLLLVNGTRLQCIICPYLLGIFQDKVKSSSWLYA